MSIFAMQLTNAFSARELQLRQNLQKNSINKLSSGTRFVNSREDSGLLSVKMKLEADVFKNASSMSKVANAVSFIDMQDGILNNAQSVLTRMTELKALGTNDPMKSDQDIDAYNNEFQNLQRQLYQLSQKTFNGTSLFSTTVKNQGGSEVRFKGTDKEKNTITVETLSSKIKLQKLPLLAALTVRANDNALQIIDDPTYGTGYDSNGNLVPSGNPDGNWSANGGNALRDANNFSPQVGPTTNWITAESGGTQDSSGNYWDSYKTMFDMSGFTSPIIATVGPSRIFGSDYEIKLNGNLVIDPSGLVNGGRWTSNQGLSELEINIKRSGGVSALALDYSISGTPIGEFILSTAYSDRLTQERTIALGVESEVSLSNLNNVPMSYLNQALENISYLRSQASGTSSRLKFINDVEYKNKSFSYGAYGRISNVDYASQSTFLAKQKIMTSVSAAMIAQANTVGDVALIMLN
jgi:flagellin